MKDKGKIHGGSNNEMPKNSYGFQILIIFISAVFSFCGAWAGNYFSIGFEKQKIQDRIILERQEDETKQILEEMGQLIKSYGEIISQSQNDIILLRNFNYPVDKSETVSSSTIDHEINILQKSCSQFSEMYLKMTSFYGVKIDGSVLTTINGYEAVIFAWQQSQKLGRIITVPRLKQFLYWLPTEVVVLPPKDIEDCNKLYNDMASMAGKQLIYLERTRRKIIDGTYSL